MRMRLSRLPVTTLFAFSSLVLMALVALGLHHALSSRIEQRAMSAVAGSADLITRVSLEPALAASLPEQRLDERAERQVDEVVAAGGRSSVLARVKVFAVSGRVLYSDEPAAVGTGDSLGPHAQDAVRRNAPVWKVNDTGSAAHRDERDLGPLMEVYVPLRADGRTVGLAELYMPIAEVQAAVASDTRRVTTQLLAGLAFLWLVLFRIVGSASRRLRAQVRRNEHQATHDELTGLPNRTLLFERTQEAVDAALRGGRSAGVLLLDLDRFKEVNDTLGHTNGDRLLQEVARRLACTLRSEDTLARLGGDEFAVLLPDVEPAGAVRLAERLVTALEQPVDLDGLPVSVGGSVGIAISPDDGSDADALVQRADVAMYVAKRAPTHIARYDGETDFHSPQRLALVGDLRTALERGELVVHFQPKADARSGAVLGMEALVRWQHPERGLLLPDVFVPLAEHTGLISALTPYVLERALAECELWRRAGHDVAVSVNVSARNLVDRDFAGTVALLLSATCVPSDRLVLEVTETAVMCDAEAALGVLRDLKRLGIELAIDDYGTGYSSLAHLQLLPIDELKIDKSFVSRLATDVRDAMIVQSTVDLAKNLNLRVVAEGVEDEQAWTALADMGCDDVQGYHLSPPLPPGRVIGWLDERQLVTIR